MKKQVWNLESYFSVNDTYDKQINNTHTMHQFISINRINIKLLYSVQMYSGSF